MYVCMYICIYNWIYILSIIFILVCMYVLCKFVRMHVCMHWFAIVDSLPLKQVCLTEETPPTKPYTATKFIHTPIPPTNTTISTTNSTTTTTTTTPVAGNRGAAVAVPVAKNLFPAESLLVHITDTQVTVLLLYVCMYVCMYVLYVCSIMYMYVCVLCICYGVNCMYVGSPVKHTYDVCTVCVYMYVCMYLCRWSL